MAKKKPKKEQTKPASGLAIARSEAPGSPTSSIFTLSWKLPTEQFGLNTQFRYGLVTTAKNSKGVWNVVSTRWSSTLNLGKNITSRRITLDFKQFYPYTYKSGGKTLDRPILNYIIFQVRGIAAPKKKKNKIVTIYEMSPWAQISFDVALPVKPKLSFSRNAAYTTGVTITPSYNNTNTRVTTLIEYQIGTNVCSAKTKKWTGIDWSKSTQKTDIRSSWARTINDTSLSKKITDSAGFIRYFRCRVRGPQGNSDWVTNHIVYDGPYAADSLNGVMTIKKKAGIDEINVTAYWKYHNSVGHPIDYMKVQYAFAAPKADLTAQEDASWEDAAIGGDNTVKPAALKTITNKKGKKTAVTTYEAKASFSIDTAMPENQLLYIRVITAHNNKETLSKEFLCRYPSTKKGKLGDIPYKNTILSKPTITSVSSPLNNRVTVAFTNNCDISGVKIALRIIPGNNKSPITIGIVSTLPPDQSQDYEVTVGIPSTYASTTFRIGAYAFIGTSTKTGAYSTYNRYSVTATIRSSEQTYGGAIPLPPATVNASHLGEGNVMVTWSWTWTAADEAEVAWSDYPDALDSNEPPSSYTINNQHSGKLIIRNLEMGKIWYFWVRLINNDNASRWSSVATESLTSAPNIPTINLSKEYITVDETVTVSWAYVSSDNSPQGAARICLCTVNKGKVTYGNIIARIPNEEQTDPETQYVVLDPKELNWTSGNTYNIALKVTSQAGLESDAWSETQTIQIVEPIESVITGTSLTPDPVKYSNTATYSQGDYVLRMVEDLDNSNRTDAQLYKATANISTPEEWSSEHWTVDEDKPYMELTHLPLRVYVDSGEGNELKSSLKIERSSDYFVDRPDNGKYGGYKGEIIYESNDDAATTNIYSVVDLSSLTNTSTYYEYDEDDHEYYLTSDVTADLSKDYYTIIATVVSEPVDSGLPNYYEHSSDTYTLTEDEHVVEGKTYYTLDVDDVDLSVGMEVASYYEYNISTGEYELTSDTTINLSKTYYYISGASKTYVINQNDLYNYLDDGATYYIVYTTEDDYGQTSEMRYEFKVKWDHQAIYPAASVELADYVYEDEVQTIAKITINNPDPSYVVAGDRCDIYRISSDGVSLIYQDAQFGETYIDPYPTIGEHGGHRIVFKTLYGDYITEDNFIAWLDFNSDEDDEDFFYCDGNLIDFGDDSVKIMFNIDTSNNWSKDFQETHYLGGAIQGDWNSGISMTSSISTNVMTNDWLTISKMRKLAQHEGICHVRTRDGMNYLANVEVSERIPYEVYYDPDGDSTHIGEYSLNITRVDPIELDGMTLADWNERHNDQEVPPDPEASNSTVIDAEILDVMPIGVTGVTE